MSNMIPYTVRRNPMSLFDDDFFRPFFTAPAMRENFRVSVKDTAEAYLLTAELPGVSRDDLSIDVNDGVLTIAAEWKRDSESNDGYIINERRAGRMQRSFTIDGVDEAAITAAYADGILTLTLPKKAEVSNSRKITIN